jgi:hypothetical protein
VKNSPRWRREGLRPRLARHYKASSGNYDQPPASAWVARLVSAGLRPLRPEVFAGDVRHVSHQPGVRVLVEVVERDGTTSSRFISHGHGGWRIDRLTPEETRRVRLGRIRARAQRMARLSGLAHG